MFGLKPDDALHVMEHATHVRRVFAAADEEDEAAHQARMRNMTMQFQTRSSQQDKQKLQQQAVELNEIGNERNDVTAANRSGTATINELIAEIAQLRGESTDVIRERVNKVRTAHYNQIVDDFLQRGFLQKDYRNDPEQMSGRAWYAP